MLRGTRPDPRGSDRWNVFIERSSRFLPGISNRSQSGLYLKTALEQLRLARKHMELERDLCACSGREGYIALH